MKRHDYDDESLKDEVSYLHALWRQGPPPPPQTQNPLPQPSSNNRQWGLSGTHHEPKTSSSSSWLNPKEPNLNYRFEPISIETQAKVAALKLQQNALFKSLEYFEDAGSDVDPLLQDQDDDEDDDDDDDEDEDVDESFEFLKKIFEEDNELREFYESNNENGEFYCLVCDGVGESLGKKFKGCAALCQHSIQISKTKRLNAHRAFARVVCQVLGWDFDKLPKILLLNGESVGRTVVTSVQNQCNEKENVDGSKESYPPVDNSWDFATGKSGETAANNGQSVLNEEAARSLIRKSEWPEWRTPKRQKTSTLAVSAAEQLKIAALQMQQKVLEGCQEFFGDGMDSESSDDDVDDNESKGEGGRKEHKFFLSVFSGNSELTNYYEKDHESGEFYCLVCGCTGFKAWRKFKSCAWLLQHSTTIQSKMWAHRAFGEVVCKVLGWDIKKLPNIVLKGEPLSRSLARVSELQANSLSVKSSVTMEPLEENGTSNNDESAIAENNTGSLDGIGDALKVHENSELVARKGSLDGECKLICP